MSQYHFKFFDRDILAITWADERKDYVRGDCYVRAVMPTYRNGHSLEAERFCLSPMTIEGIRSYVAARPERLGSQIHDCLGIILMDDNYRVVLFAEPIQVRNHGAP